MLEARRRVEANLGHQGWNKNIGTHAKSRNNDQWGMVTCWALHLLGEWGICSSCSLAGAAHCKSQHLLKGQNQRLPSRLSTVASHDCGKTPLHNKSDLWKYASLECGTTACCAYNSFLQLLSLLVWFLFLVLIWVFLFVRLKNKTRKKQNKKNFWLPNAKKQQHFERFNLNKQEATEYKARSKCPKWQCNNMNKH